MLEESNKEHENCGTQGSKRHHLNGSVDSCLQMIIGLIVLVSRSCNFFRKIQKKIIIGKKMCSVNTEKLTSVRFFKAFLDTEVLAKIKHLLSFDTSSYFRAEEITIQYG